MDGKGIATANWTEESIFGNVAQLYYEGKPSEFSAPASVAIDLLRDGRSPMVLSNPTFVKQLLDLEERRHEWEE